MDTFGILIGSVLFGLSRAASNKNVENNPMHSSTMVTREGC